MRKFFQWILLIIFAHEIYFLAISLKISSLTTKSHSIRSVAVALFSSRKLYLPTELQFTKLLFVESGFGCDQHGQNSTKAAVRACRNAIEFNSLPGIRDVIPGGKANMILRLEIAVPNPSSVDLNAVAAVFPYGKLLVPQIIDGGMSASSGIALPELGDTNDQMIFAIAVVSVGY
mmetsp:Transcript_16353/g.22536  ORF Transcript_16353/g.22536 Transcript_16353/m.22536 type:complete len:175 (-) Transcript_16353:66-590(-)